MLLKVKIRMIEENGTYLEAWLLTWLVLEFYKGLKMPKRMEKGYSDVSQLRWRGDRRQF